MRNDEGWIDNRSNGAARTRDISYVIFSLAHAECGQECVIELRLGERWLLGWCPRCATLEIFGSPD
jgi:hypothetical protein